MRGPKPQSVVLLSEHIEILRKNLRNGTTEKRVADRSRILLFSYEGRNPGEIARGLDCGRNTVWRTLERYKSGGLERALYDRPRSGRRRRIFPPRPSENSSLGL